MKRFAGAKFKSFRTQQEAEAFVRHHAARRHSTNSAPRGDPSSQQDASMSSGTKRPKPNNTDTMTDDSPPRPRKKAALPPKGTADTPIVVNASVMFDGGSRGNPGCGGAGAVVVIAPVQNNDSSTSGTTNTTIRIRHFLGRCTNNEAEYSGLCQGLKAVLGELQRIHQQQQQDTKPLKVNLKVRGDSELIIKQVTGKYKCNKPGLRGYLVQVRTLMAAMEALGAVEVAYEHVLRARNSVADGKSAWIILVVCKSSCF